MDKELPEVLRPNFGEFSPAMKELIQSWEGAVSRRESLQGVVDRCREELERAERDLADNDCRIESDESAIRILVEKW
jgi:hypothetical protein